jgi:hypothetical protein
MLVRIIPESHFVVCYVCELWALCVWFVCLVTEQKCSMTKVVNFFNFYMYTETVMNNEKVSFFTQVPSELSSRHKCITFCK